MLSVIALGYHNLIEKYEEGMTLLGMASQLSVRGSRIMDVASFKRINYIIMNSHRLVQIWPTALICAHAVLQFNERLYKIIWLPFLFCWTGSGDASASDLVWKEHVNPTRTCAPWYFELNSNFRMLTMTMLIRKWFAGRLTTFAILGWHDGLTSPHREASSYNSKPLVSQTIQSDVQYLPLVFTVYVWLRNSKLHHLGRNVVRLKLKVKGPEIKLVMKTGEISINKVLVNIVKPSHWLQSMK